MMRDDIFCELYFYRNEKPVIIRDLARLQRIIFLGYKNKKKPEFMLLKSRDSVIRFDFGSISTKEKPREMLIRYPKTLPV